MIPQSFLTADAMLLLGRNLADGLQVHSLAIERRVAEQLPFIAAEELLMEGVSDGADRQTLHERIRCLTWEAREKLDREGGENPLRELLKGDPEVGPLLAKLPPWDPERFVGLAPSQTRDYLDQVVSELPIPPEDDLRELTV